jgi:hypothetical protein
MIHFRGIVPRRAEHILALLDWRNSYDVCLAGFIPKGTLTTPSGGSTFVGGINALSESRDALKAGLNPDWQDHSGSHVLRERTQWQAN